ncbi:hypothetical protein Leryth_010036 [Lithospermum erythrorhizon]|nr:hypothetical protein Leryth_010036 [Lithospermum erythrorhizon]
MSTISFSSISFNWCHVHLVANRDWWLPDHSFAGCLATEIWLWSTLINMSSLAFPGYYFSGNGCRRDKDGCYWLTGRVDDVISIRLLMVPMTKFKSFIATLCHQFLFSPCEQLGILLLSSDSVCTLNNSN